MKLSIYKIYALLFIVTFNGYSQTKEVVLKKSFDVNENTVLSLDLDNVVVVFEESLDGKIHFDYSIVFKNNSDELKYKVFKGIDANVFKENNTISLDIKNSMLLGELYNLDVDIDTYKSLIMGYYLDKKKNEFLYKSKDSLLKEIGFSLGSSVDDFFKNLKKKHPNKNFGKSSRKFEQKFIIKMPKHLEININALHSKIAFHFNIKKQLNVNSFKTYFKFKKIVAKENRIIASNGIFQAEKVTNGRMEFLDMRKVVIGEVSNMSIATETSRIQIGEIVENVDFNDFNSKLYFYNFRDNFKKFNFKGDYSELNFYHITKSNFSMDVFGHNTTLNMNETKTSFGLSKDKKLNKILEKKVKENKISQGNIAIELKNGILNIK